jgi:predicted double-glycine peptidase
MPVLMTVVVSVLFSTLLVKLPKPRRAAVIVVMTIMLINYGLLPAAMPLLARSALASTRTLLDRQGVCRQTHGYTCGPASAVTCLGRFGIRAEEGALAIAARCGPVVGTHGAVLAAAVREMFPGVETRHRFAKSVEDLQLPAAVEMFMPLVGGHFVAVLGVEEGYVEVGDPLNGASRMPRGDFDAWWTGAAVEFGVREK